jgi:hypothetical protein
MKLFFPIALLATALALGGYVVARSDVRAVSETTSNAREIALTGKGSGLERLERSAKIRPGTKRSLGTLALSGGRRVELLLAETEDGRACLIEASADGGASAGCLEGGLFRHRRVEFSVAFDGGPDTFDELYVTGVVAPNVKTAQLVMTNGDVTELALTDERAFAFESPRSALRRDVFPTAFRLYGASGKLIDVETFAPPGD